MIWCKILGKMIAVPKLPSMSSVIYSVIYRAFGLRNKLVHYLLTLHFVWLVEWKGLIHHHLIPHKLIIISSTRNGVIPPNFGIDLRTTSSRMEWFLKSNTVLMVYFNKSRITHSHIASLMAVSTIFFHADICRNKKFMFSLAKNLQPYA
jgi:hypothetical protein